MADQNTSLPVRTQTNGDVAVKVVDGTVTSQQLTVNANGSAETHVVNDRNFGVVGADTIRVGAQVGNSTGAADFGAGATTAQTLRTVANLSINGTTPDTNFGTVGANTLRSAAQIGNATGAADFANGASTAQTLRVAANLNFAGSPADTNYGTVGATTLRTASQIGNSTGAAAFGLGVINAQTLRTASLITNGTNTLAVNADGSINVVVQEDVGTETVNYNTTVALAAAASSNHDLVFATASKLYQVLASGSGKIKVEVQVESGSATNTFNTVAVNFNSTAAPNVDINLAKYALIPVGARVRVIRTNLDLLPQNVYSTIVGILT